MPTIGRHYLLRQLSNLQANAFRTFAVASVATIELKHGQTLMDKVSGRCFLQCAKFVPQPND